MQKCINLCFKKILSHLTFGKTRGLTLQKRVWLAWETQRRSVELAGKLGCKLYIIEYEGIIRYPVSIIKTINILIRTKPDILFVQNPSMILAALACIYRLITEVPVVVDRHTTFRLHKPHSGSFRIWLFMRLHYFTIRMADLTIVTNDFLAGLVKHIGGSPFVLPDKLPYFISNNKIELKGKRNILLISSFGEDEPIEEAIDAISALRDKSVCLYVTGNYKKLDDQIYSSSPMNVIFTGFLDDQNFINMLFSTDAIMALTTSDYVMLCGCYEAVSAEKPLITSDKEVLREYFKGAVFVDNSSQGISDGIREVIKNIDVHRRNIHTLKQTLLLQWEERYNIIENLLYTLQ